MGTPSHTERTAAEPRDGPLHEVIISHVDEFLPGQWLDVHVPDIPKPGGFTITSPPSKAQIEVHFNQSSNPYLELAVQMSPSNSVAAFIWQPLSSILASTLHVQVGGSFVWPPPSLDINIVKRVVFVAGGVGINPLMSIVSHLAETDASFEIRFLYSFRCAEEGYGTKILFENRLKSLFERGNVTGELAVHRTSGGKRVESLREERVAESVVYKERKVRDEDILKALGPVKERGGTLCYICGVPTMTDRFIEIAANAEGMDKSRVLFERWW